MVFLTIFPKVVRLIPAHPGVPWGIAGSPIILPKEANSGPKSRGELCGGVRAQVKFPGDESDGRFEGEALWEFGEEGRE